ncbi:MAG: VPLPA-CTERM sorting domain-containing protein [Gammaproteobacteria bacterium]|nr:VPLPA-CTERM sorting domain-containing protein [Gammaproteobacteria bacterium]
MPAGSSIAARMCAAAALALCLTLPASAMTVVYGWAPYPGQGGSGSLTFSDPGITSATDFSAIPASALTALNYSWDNGASISLGSVINSHAPGWTACGGVLISGFQISAAALPSTPGIFSLTNIPGICLPGPMPVAGPGWNLSLSLPYGAESNWGNWIYSHTVAATVVPVPAAAWLFASGMAGLLGLRRRGQSPEKSIL